MTNERKLLIHRIYGIAVSVSAVVAGICLMVACVGIYRSGDQPYSREAVAAAFSPIAIAVYLCLALVIGGFILHFALPVEKKQKMTPQVEMTWQRLAAKADLDACDSAVREEILALRKQRQLHWYISLAVLALGCICFLIYALNPSHFHQSEINDSMIRAMQVMLPCLLIPFGYALFASYFSKRSMEKEIGLLRSAPKGSAPSPAKKNGFLFWLRIGVVTAAVVLMVYGFLTGGTRDVLTKAVNICTECIGLG